MNSKHLSVTVLEAGKFKIMTLANWVAGEGPFLIDGTFAFYHHMVEEPILSLL
jgi:hypothetical protein